MKTRTVIERIGEYLGPVDWSYDFAQHFTTLGIHDAPAKQAYIQKKIDWLRELEQHPDDYLATTDGGSPKFGWHRVLQVGMYDGWPHWRPVPSVCLSGVLGAEWHSFYFIMGIEKK